MPHGIILLVYDHSYSERSRAIDRGSESESIFTPLKIVLYKVLLQMFENSIVEQYSGDCTGSVNFLEKQQLFR
ncbi:uncharacterized protein Bfra_002957 [Botrytis fragariae]|uniref:Uncharacterized protein n=1 Tax=Botrytis fragariae TaxID=1964551 RepID=A0A8H6AZV9_9HELO|nr:uncharacterized protein Bfra_002957 [Botrytis fragariae]KAF5876552.1 hypothetical protein Bfra_002957 [Botrytis fragariae]